MSPENRMKLQALLPIEYEATSEGIRPRMIESPDPDNPEKTILRLAMTTSSEVFEPLVAWIDQLVAEGKTD